MSSLGLDGSSSLRITSNVLNVNNNFAVSFWLKMGSTIGKQTLLWIGDATTSDAVYVWDGVFVLETINESTLFLADSGIEALEDEEVFCLFYRDGDDLKFETKSQALIATQNPGSRVMAYAMLGTNPYDERLSAKIEAMNTWTRILSVEEKTAQALQATPVSLTNLYAQHDFTTPDRLNDKSGAGNHWTAYNGVTTEEESFAFSLLGEDADTPPSFVRSNRRKKMYLRKLRARERAQQEMEDSE